MRKTPYTLKSARRALVLDTHTAIMGILNVTPDSFSDGGRFFDPEQAIAQADAMIAAGASIIDIGGESTRPGSTPVPAKEEWVRIEPVIKALADRDVWLSVDTFKHEVAARALEAGVDMINDITGLLGDPELAAVVAQHQAAVCLMHNAVLYRGKRAPGAFPRFGHDNEKALEPLSHMPVTEAIVAFHAIALEQAERAGIARASILLDPGFGFGLELGENLTILNHLSDVMAHPYPYLIALSRKRFVQALGGDVDQTTAWLGFDAVRQGAHMLRVHDVAAQAPLVSVADRLDQSL